MLIREKRQYKWQRRPGDIVREDLYLIKLFNRDEGDLGVITGLNDYGATLHWFSVRRLDVAPMSGALDLYCPIEELYS